MTARRIPCPGRLLWAGAALIVLGLFAMTGAQAQFNPFGEYMDNVARVSAHNATAEVQHLLAEGKDPNDTDDQGRTGLEFAAINGNRQLAELLIKARAQLNQADRLGDTPLHAAVEHNHIEIVEMLLDAGAAVDPQNRSGMTPLMIAASRGELPIVRALLNKGADVGKTDYTGRDARGWAADSRRPAVIQAIERAAHGRS